MPPQDATPPQARHGVYRLGRIEFNEGTRELRVGGEPQAIETKPLMLFAALLARAPNVVTKDELLETVWPDVEVEESSITTAVHQLRAALGPQGRDIVKTVPRFGYRIAEKFQLYVAEAPAPNPPELTEGAPVYRRPPWRLDKPLGDGTQHVWRAIQDGSREARVFKFAYTPDRLDALKREAALFRILRDRLGPRDDFVPIFEMNFDEPPYFIESPYAGDTLDAWATAQGGLNQLPLASRLDMMARIAGTVADAHGAGVLHGDIKPSNILISAGRTEAPAIRLIDFGAGGLTEAARRAALSRTLQQDAAPADSDGTGTWLYMAPEVAHGGPPSIKADVYALGILLYQMVLSDLHKPLAAGWEADIADEVLRDLIADAAAGNVDRRLDSAGALADRLINLDAARADMRGARKAAADAAAAAEQLRRARMRRPWLAMAGLCLMLGVLASSVAAIRASRARNEAERQEHVATQLNLFLTRDLLGRGTPRNSGKPDETLMEAAARAEPMIARHFGNDPLVAATIYAALARAYDDRSALPEARDAYDKAVAAYERAQGAMSANAAIIRLHRAIMETGARNAASLATAKSIVASAAASLPQFGPRRDEVQVWLWAAQGTIAVADGNAGAALPALRDAAQQAAAMPEIFDEDDRLGMRFREGQALIFAGKYAAARDILADVVRDADLLHGPRYIDTLLARIQHAQALDFSGDPEGCIAEIKAIQSDLLAVLGPRQREVVVATSVLADAENSIGDYPDAERDEKSAYDLAVATLDAHSFGVINTLAGLATAQCRAGDAAAGLDNAARAFAAATATFGAKHPITQAFGLVQVQCLTVAKRFPQAQATLRSLDRDAAAKALADPYPGESFDVLDAKIAFELGDVQRTRTLLVPLTRAFAKDQSDRFFGNWVKQLAAATRPAMTAVTAPSAP